MEVLMCFNASLIARIMDETLNNDAYKQHINKLSNFVNNGPKLSFQIKRVGVTLFSVVTTVKLIDYDGRTVSFDLPDLDEKICSPYTYLDNHLYDLKHVITLGVTQKFKSIECSEHTIDLCVSIVLDESSKDLYRCFDEYVFKEVRKFWDSDRYRDDVRSEYEQFISKSFEMILLKSTEYCNHEFLHEELNNALCKVIVNK